MNQNIFNCLLQNLGNANFAGGGIYLIVFIAIGAFIFANLVVAVVVTNLECAVLDVRKEEEEIAKEHESKVTTDKEDEKIAKIIGDAEIQSIFFKRQEPLFIPVSTRWCTAFLSDNALVLRY